VEEEQSERVRMRCDSESEETETEVLAEPTPFRCEIERLLGPLKSFLSLTYLQQFRKLQSRIYLHLKRTGLVQRSWRANSPR
jgi:hypothetical protein